MITAFGRAEVMQRLGAQRLAVGAVLTKPVTPSTLLNSFAQALGRPILGESRGTQRNGHLDEHRENLRGARILLVDDHEFNQELAMELLKDAGMKVTLANDGQQALDLLAERDFDGVLMDCQMPVMDGYTATRMLRQRPALADLPVIAMTANALVGERDKVLACGMNDYIAKPLDVEQMFAVIAKWVVPRLGGPARPSAWQPASDAPVLKPMPGVDMDMALAKVGGNVALYKRWLDLFGATHQDFVVRLRAARAGADTRALGRLAHSVKGAAGTIGAIRVSAAASRLEDECDLSRDPGVIDALCAALVSEVNAVLAVLPPIE